MMTEAESKLNVAEVVAFWELEADEAYEVAQHLVAKADYSYALPMPYSSVTLRSKRC
jgi:hypothetical protein